MSPTAKILLGAGATGIAGYLLWRLWPGDEPVMVTPDYTPPYQQPTVPDFVIPDAARTGPTYVPPTHTFKMPRMQCPPGTDLVNGECIPWTIE